MGLNSLYNAMRTKYIKLKNDVDCDDLLHMNPHLLMILASMNVWCLGNDCELVISSAYRTPTENRLVGAKSMTHCEDRAFDVSIRSEFGFNEVKIRELIKHVEDNFKHVGALNRIGESRPVVRHIGTADHLHIQVRRGL